MKVLIEKNRYLDKFFKVNIKYSEILKKEIEENILNIINQKPYKIKMINKLKYSNCNIYEYKIILDKNFTCRVAYIKNSSEIVVFYISKSIIQQEFIKEISTLKKISKKI